MTQIEQIRQEIERLKSQLVRGACAAEIAMETNCKDEAYNEVLAFIDSLPVDSKIEQIKAELQKRLLKYDPDMTNAGRELQEVLAFIDSSSAKTNGPVYDVSCGLSKTPPAFKLDVKPDSPDFEAEWKRYTHTRKDDMRTNAVTMNVKEVAKHFAEWQKEQSI